MKWRREALDGISKTEKDRCTMQLTAALAWLGLDNIPYCGQAHQDNLRDRLVKECCDGTTDWILNHSRMRAWLQNGRGPSVLWLNGIPGSGPYQSVRRACRQRILIGRAGKSTLCAKLIQFLRLPRQVTVLFCFYSYNISSVHPDPVVFLLATLVSQILRQHIDLVSYVYDEFVAEARPLSVRDLQELVSNLLCQLDKPRILVDGIDECIRYDANGKPCDLTPLSEVLTATLQLEKLGQGNTGPKVVLVSRDISQISLKLAKKPTVALYQEKDAVTADIQRFTNQRLRGLRERFVGFNDIDDVLRDVSNSIVSMSQGWSPRFLHSSHNLN
jgi:hypothetical protein